MRPFRQIALKTPAEAQALAPLLSQLEADLRLNFNFNQRVTETTTFSGLAAAASGEATLQLGKSYLLHSITSSHAARLSIYGTSAGRTADSSRAFGDPVPANVPLVYDAEFDPSASEGTRYPFTVGSNLDVPPSGAAYLRLTNLTGGSADVTLTIIVSALEP